MFPRGIVFRGIKHMCGTAFLREAATIALGVLFSPTSVDARAEEWEVCSNGCIQQVKATFQLH